MSTLWGPPGNLRLVVIDLETCVGPDRRHRVVAAGAVVCRGRLGSPGRSMAWLVDPGCPVDPATTRVHGLTDAHLAGQPPFSEVAPELLRLLEPGRDETVVVAAHHAPFDMTVLRQELERVGATAMPELPILDTAGRLPALAGVEVDDRRLATLLAALGVVNERAHDALADATATADAARLLLERAEDAGHTDLGSLLAALGAGTTHTARGLPPPAGRAPAEPVLPPDHVARHGRPVPAPAGEADLARVRDLLAECASLRCDGIAGEATVMPAPVLRRLLFDAIAASVSTGDRAGTNTLLAGLAPTLLGLPSGIDGLRAELPGVERVAGQGGRRGVALIVAAWLAGQVGAAGRCPTIGTPCPSCRDGLGCAADTWPEALVPLVFEGTRASANGLWNSRGMRTTAASKGGGRGYLAIRTANPSLADAAAAACHRWLVEQGDGETAARLADQLWTEAGCREPSISESRAVATASGGRDGDLVAALAVCQVAFAVRGGSTAPAWSSLVITAAALEGRLNRLRTPSGRRHHPVNPARPPRQPRFLRRG